MAGACAAASVRKTPTVPPPPPPAPFSVFEFSWSGGLNINVSGASGNLSSDYFTALFGGGVGSAHYTIDYGTRTSSKISFGSTIYGTGVSLAWSGLTVGESVGMSAVLSAHDDGGATTGAVCPSSGIIVIKRVS